jgi:hypothetical protein
MKLNKKLLRRHGPATAVLHAHLLKMASKKFRTETLDDEAAYTVQWVEIQYTADAAEYELGMNYDQFNQAASDIYNCCSCKGWWSSGCFIFCLPHPLSSNKALYWNVQPVRLGHE